LVNVQHPITPVVGQPVPGVPFSDSVQLDDSLGTSLEGTSSCVQRFAAEALHENVTVPLPLPEPPLPLEHASNVVIPAAHNEKPLPFIGHLLSGTESVAGRRFVQGAFTVEAAR
jgi:hypothetical protein